jgi:hypothetical protein
MKLKALLLALFLAGLTASLALADPGKHGEKAKGAAAAKCRPSIELELAGTAASAPSGGSLAVLVSKGGAEGAQLAGKQLTLDVSQAKLHGQVAAGAPLRVHARACVDLVALTVKLVATQVNGGRGGGREGASGSTSSTTSTNSTP